MYFYLLHFFLVGCLLFAKSETRKTYDGYQVFNIPVQTHSQLHYLKLLASRDKLEFFEEPFTAKGQEGEVLIAPDTVEEVTHYLQQEYLVYRVANPDVGSFLREEFDRFERRRDENGKLNYDFNDYNDYDAMMAQLQVFVSNCSAPLSCSVEEIGTTSENRTLSIFQITTSPGDEAKTGVWLDSLIHAREWVAGTTVMNVLNHVIQSYGTDAEITYLLDTYNFYFLPVMNPDGYIYAWEQDRFWRKSRNVNDGSSCMGTDLNRNYDASWSTDGTSTNPCADNYHGSGPGSEPETQTVQDKSSQLPLIAFISVHSAANMWLHPFGNTQPNGTCERAVDHEDLFHVAELTAVATMAAYNTTWTYGSICETIYPASGGTIDYVYEKAGVAYSYTPELRGPGFDPPPSVIEPAWREFWAGVKAMIFEIEKM